MVARQSRTITLPPSSGRRWSCATSAPGYSETVSISVDWPVAGVSASCAATYPLEGGTGKHGHYPGRPIRADALPW